ncbi:MAG: AAA family ATPase [Polyangiaceae bacterium]
MTSIPSDLRRVDAFPEPRPKSVDLVETHLSWVFLTEDAAFKVKRPVYYGFVDFRTLEARRLACEAEVTLNRRLAPDVYLGVVPVRRDERGMLSLTGQGEAVDWAVYMRRLPDECRADSLLAAGALDAELVEHLADRLVEFHGAARCDAETARFGAPDSIATNVMENFAQTRDQVTDLVSVDEAREIERNQLEFLRSHEAAFLARARTRTRSEGGRVCDGHGDLRLEHVYFEKGRLSIIDCIEFNDRFRFGDVCADVAFLAMDLVSHGRADLAELFLARYARSADDYDLYALVDFYEAYRAHVRAKVATFVAADPEASPHLRSHKMAEARRHLVLALATGRRSLLPPVLVAVGGVIAAGKSTVAAALARQMSAPVVDADRTRKHLLGVPETRRIDESAWHGAYDPHVTEHVYGEVLRRAAVVLASGRSVIVDASFRSRKMRADARAVAEAHAVPFLLVECRADRATCMQRLEERGKVVAVSDGRPAIFDAFCANFEPILELAAGEHLVVHTTRPLHETVADLRSRVPVWPDASIP